MKNISKILITSIAMISVIQFMPIDATKKDVKNIPEPKIEKINFEDVNLTFPLEPQELAIFLGDKYGENELFPGYEVSSASGYIYFHKNESETEADQKRFVDEAEKYFKQSYATEKNQGEGIFWSKELIDTFKTVEKALPIFHLGEDPDLVALFMATLDPSYFLQKKSDFETERYNILKTDSIDTPLIEKLKNGLIELAASSYKIHIQVKQEYLLSFIGDFMNYISMDNELKDAIGLFKVTQKYSEGSFIPYKNKPLAEWKHGPIIVVYLNRIIGSLKDKNIKLASIISKLEKRYEKFIDEIALPYLPRLNYRINKLIYLAGGNADEKMKLLYENQKLLLSDDLAFFKGHEYPNKGDKKLDLKPIELPSSPLTPKVLAPYINKKSYSYWQNKSEKKHMSFVKPEYDANEDQIRFFEAVRGIVSRIAYFLTQSPCQTEKKFWSQELIEMFIKERNTPTLNANVHPELHEMFLMVSNPKSINNFIKKMKNNEQRELIQKKYNILNEAPDKINESFAKILQASLMALTASVYDIHIQVNKSYLISFLSDFFDYIYADRKLLESISEIKITNNYKNIENRAFITIRLNKIIAFNKENKNETLASIISKLVDRYKDVASKIALKNELPYRYKINDLFYLTGGHIDEKMKIKNEDKELILSEDKAFFKGHEYSEPIK